MISAPSFWPGLAAVPPSAPGLPGRNGSVLPAPVHGLPDVGQLRVLESSQMSSAASYWPTAGTVRSHTESSRDTPLYCNGNGAPFGMVGVLPLLHTFQWQPVKMSA